MFSKTSMVKMVVLLMNISTTYVYTELFDDFVLDQCKEYFHYTDEELALCKNVLALDEHPQRITYPQKNNVIGSIPILFKRYQKLQSHIAYVSLANLPTPILKVSDFSSLYHLKEFSIKRDDLSAHTDDGIFSFGGNKPRKLEWWLGHALSLGAKTIVTFGGIGSNHTVATSVYAKQLGLQTIVLAPKHSINHITKRNLLLHASLGTQLHILPSRQTVKEYLPFVLMREKMLHGQLPYIIPFGGSNPLGSLGFVNAAFELHEQIKQGLLEIPDYLYIPCGTCGTTAGLIVGLKASKLPTHVVAVAVEKHTDDTELKNKIIDLCNQTVALIRRYDHSFPAIKVTENDFTVLIKHAGKAYAKFTKAGNKATKLFKTIANVDLEGVYSAKAAAAMMHDIMTSKLKNKRVLFWLTCTADRFDDYLKDADSAKLPYLAQQFIF